MWIVLLDHSCSMGGRFENPLPAGRLVRVAEAETRLEAAKAVFLEQLGRLPAEMPVSLFGFTSTARHLVTAPAGAVSDFRTALSGLQPENGTDIAVALGAAAEHVEGLSTPPPLRRVLLISDGESSLEPAVAAAQRCKNLGMTIDALLIDPGLESERVASEVTGMTLGRWDPVTSLSQLRGLATQTADTVRGETEAAKILLDRLAAEEEAAAQRRQAEERVMFSAGYPARVQPRRNYELRVVMHGEGERDDIQEKLKALLANADLMPRVAEADARQLVPLGTVLRIEPTMDGVIFAPLAAELLWRGDATEARFQFHLAAESAGEQTLPGMVAVKHQSGLLVAELDLQILALAPESTVEPDFSVAQARFVGRVFASYAHADEPIVRACKEAYLGLGITLWMDYDDIPQNALWRNTIQIAIGKADLFQLFWSKAASLSVEVANEIELALVVGRSRPDPFIRSVYWEVPPPEPPRPLVDVQLKRLDLGWLDLTARSEPRLARQTVSPDIAEQATVLALTPNADAATIELVRSSIGAIVAFLEEFTGLRYLPAPTLLVDRLTVKAVRAVETVDMPDPLTAQSDPGEAWLLPLLNALLMAFHMGKVEEVPSTSERPRFYQLREGEALGDFDHIRDHSEGGFCELVERGLDGHDPMRAEGSWAKAFGEADSSGRSLLAFSNLRRWLARIAAIAPTNEVELLRQIPGLSLQESPDCVSAELDEKKWPLVRDALTQASIQTIIEKYNTAFFERFYGERTRLARSPDLTAYVRQFLDLLRSYARRALAVRGPATIEGAFRASRALFEAARGHFPDLHITPIEKPYDGTYFEIPLDDYLICLEALQHRLLSLLASAPSSPIRRLVEASVPAYGIFASARSATAGERLEQLARTTGLPDAMLLPGTNKVLLAADAVNDLAAELTAAGETDASRRSADLLRLVLVHEHFHGVLAAGLDSQGQTAPAARRPDQWARGAAVNESLAAWSELH
jgi:hypothetical protein